MAAVTTVERSVASVAEMPDALRLAAACGPFSMTLTPKIAIQLAHDLDRGRKATEDCAALRVASQADLAKADALLVASQAELAKAVASIRSTLCQGMALGIGLTVVVFTVATVLRW